MGMTDVLPDKGADIAEFTGKIWWADCLDLLARLPDKSVQLILTDFPYGITQASYDKKEALPDYAAVGCEMFRVIEHDGALITTAAQPFTSKLVMLWEKYFRYEWIWRKTRKTNFLNAKKMPLSAHESILVFGHKLPKYYPQMIEGERHYTGAKSHRGTSLYGSFESEGVYNDFYYPDSVIEFPHDPDLTATNKQKPERVWIHANSKPLALWGYLLNTYSLQGDIVLDCFSGSGTTAIACTNLDRKFICADLHEPYALASRERLARHNPFVDSPLKNGAKQLSLFSHLDDTSK